MGRGPAALKKIKGWGHRGLSTCRGVKTLQVSGQQEQTVWGRRESRVLVREHGGSWGLYVEGDEVAWGQVTWKSLLQPDPLAVQWGGRALPLRGFGRA